MKLPAFCEVCPAHGAGSLCGRAMGAKRTSTIGYEQKYNGALQIASRAEFVRALTTNMPPAPDHFSRCSATNGAGPEHVRNLPVLRPFEPADFAARARRKRTIVLDARSYEAFGGQHVPGAYHIDLGGNFSTFAGWVLPVDQDILLVTESAEDAAEAAALLRRVGLDRAVGYLDGGMFAWATAGLPTDHVPQVSPPELHELACRGDGLTLLDVRAAREFEALHIEGAVNIPAPDLRTRSAELRSDAPVVAICSTGHRSSLAASLLQQRGFRDVRNAAGGMTGYGSAGYAAECPMCVAPHIPAPPRAAR